MMRYEELLVNKNTILLLLKCDDIAKKYYPQADIFKG